MAEKKKKKGKKGKKKDKIDTGLDPQSRAEMASALMRSLQQKFSKVHEFTEINELVAEQEVSDKEKAAENELRARVLEFDKDLHREKEKLVSITYSTVLISTICQQG